MSFGCFINPETGRFNEDHLLAKAFEALRLEFMHNVGMDDFEAFAAANYKRAQLILQVEGFGGVVSSLRPFAEGWCSTPAREIRNREAAADRWQTTNPEMARLIRKGML